MECLSSRVCAAGNFRMNSMRPDAKYEEGKLLLQLTLRILDRKHVRVIVDADTEREAWLKLSEKTLTQVWANDADDIFNDLLEK